MSIGIFEKRLKDLEDERAYRDNVILDLQKQLAQERERSKRLVEALRFVIDRENLTFAECRDAEEIISRCKEALREYEEKS